MRSFFRKPVWIAIVLLAVLSCIVVFIAGTPALARPAPDTGAMTSGSAAVLHVLDNIIPQKEFCTREVMDQCEYGCMMPGGVLDLNCYEDCIYSVC